MSVCMGSDLQFQHVPVHTGDGSAMVAAMVAEMRELYDGLDIEAPDMPKAGAAELGPPGGTFLVGYRDGRPMYVVSDERGKGLARVLLHALEDAARGLGYRIARLDTGPRQPHAQGLYQAEGYRTVPNFNGNPVATFFGEKRLDPAGD